VQNFSSRRGVPPRIFVLHYTVSANRPGWSDVYAVSSLFDRPAFSASSNYVIDNEGHCAYIVRESDKAWTQAAANPFSISAEIINTGHEPTLAAKAGLEKLGLVIDDAAKRWDIPLQEGLVRGCVVVRPGIVDHHSLGACGGGHFDITPYSVPQVIAAARKHRGTPAQPPRVVLVPCTVRNLQKRLRIAVDGQVGPKTRLAIRELQGKHNITTTGYAGVKVAKILGLKDCAI
jgi:peptidoglycan hydrolase-like protein with peptidoglycan-binding domain